MPHISIAPNKIFIKPFPVLISINSDDSKLAFTDIGGNLSIININITDGQIFDT